MTYELMDTKDESEDKKEISYHRTFNPLWVLADVGIFALKVLGRVFQLLCLVISTIYNSFGWIIRLLLNIFLLGMVVAIVYFFYAFSHGMEKDLTVLFILIAIMVVVGVLKILSDSLGDIFVFIGDLVGELVSCLEFQSPFGYKENK